MSPETRVLSIRTIDGLKVTLEIQGTILVYRRSCRAFDEEAWIPVESVELSERRRFRAGVLIIGLLSLLCVVLLPAPFLALMYVLPVEWLDVLHLAAWDRLYIYTLLVACGVFLTCLVRFLMRHRTVRLYCLDEHSIEYWKDKKTSERAEAFNSLLQERQRLVEEHTTEMADLAVAFTDDKSMLFRILGMTLPSCLPAVIIEDARLLLLALLPVLWFLYKQIALVKQPRLYKQAWRHYRHKQWNQAISNLTELLRDKPDHTPAHILLVWAHTRLGQYDLALQAVSNFPEEDCDLAEDLHSEIWRFKRLDKRRQETV